LTSVLYLGGALIKEGFGIGAAPRAQFSDSFKSVEVAAVIPESSI